ncbi:methyltransferase [Staphylococcus sp. 30400_3112M30941]|nr:methyltransferase [Staphylococcus sp. 30403_3112M30944]MBO0945704.1 methyltransferase [Staphylococcus sp. 30402_3112M30943]MBO0963546.1 methyltransferase [Staphylococcus sp. 30400_3112M30941]MBO0966712.1 methyltransferase [Staphylococcus sp. 30401_3112M30942]
MEVQQLIKSFEEQGIVLWIDGEKLKYRAPKDRLQQQHLQQLKAHKSKIIEYLKSVAKLIHHESDRYEPFPLTQMQRAYAIGRNIDQELGGVGCKSYVEIKISNLSPEKFEECWHTLIKQHDILSTIVTEEYFHNYLDIKVMPSLKVNDLRQQDKEYAHQKFLEKRNELQSMHFNLDTWPLHHFELSLFEDFTIIHFVIDMIIGDFLSVHQIMNELMKLYYDEQPSEELFTFRDVVMFEQGKQEDPREQQLYLRDRDYWMNKISEMPIQPELPVRVETFNNKSVSFSRHSFSIVSSKWSDFKNKCTKFNVTPSNAVLTIYRDLIQQNSLTDAFSINITLMNRHEYCENIDNVIGDFTSVNVLDTSSEEETFKERVLQIQKELFTNLDHKRFNGIEVLRELSRYRGMNVIIPVVYTSTLGIGENSKQFNVEYGVSETPQVLIDCQVFEADGVFECNLDIRDKAFEDIFIEKFVAEFKFLLSKLAEDESLWYSDNLLNKTLLDQSLVEHHQHKIHLIDIDNRMTELRKVDKSYTVEIKNDKETYLKTYIKPVEKAYKLKNNTYSKLREHLQNVSNNTFENIDSDIFKTWIALSEITSLVDMLDVFRSVDIFNEVGNYIHEEELIEQLSVSEKFVGTVKRWLTALCKEFYLVKNNQKYALSYLGQSHVLRRNDYWQAFEQVEEKLNYSRTLFDYQKESSKQLLAQIQDKINGLNLFFPQGTTEIAMAAYNKNLVNKGLNNIVKEAVKQLCNSQTDPVHILEVGGGVAATTIDVLPVLENIKFNYDFTDVSYYFLNHGKNILSHYKNINYKLFDINKSYAQQGFEKQHYDMILCPNVLHNSEHALLVLNQLNDLLKPNGYLIMIEATTESYSLMTSLELKGGLDHFKDIRKDTNETFFNREQWHSLLEEAHFKPIVMLPEKSDVIYESGQSVLVSQSMSPSLKVIEEEITKEILYWPKYMHADVFEVTNQVPKDESTRKLWVKKLQETDSINLDTQEISKPKSQLEGSLLKSLKILLERDDIGVYDNFYQIGGDSLLVAKWITEIQSDIDLLSSFSFEELMKAFAKKPTVHAFANKLYQFEASKEITATQESDFLHNHKYIKDLHTTNEDPKVIKGLFHAGTGRLLDYNYILPHLIDECQNNEHIYGFTYGDVTEYVSHPYKNLVELLAYKYAKALMELDADEYELYGYCVGGFLAIETAKILLENGRNVKPINLISSHLCLHHVSNSLLMETAFASIIGADLAKTGYSFSFEELTQALSSLVQGESRDISDEELFSLEEDERYQNVGAAYRKLYELSQHERLKRIYQCIPEQNFNGTNNSFEKLVELYEVFNHTYLGMIHYMPETYLGDVNVFEPKEYVTDFYPKTKEDVSWKKFVLGNIVMMEVEGNHATCLDYNHTDRLMEEMRNSRKGVK